MVVDVLKTLYARDLQKLKVELELYHHEENIWRIDNDIKNTAGNLCLHLVGNLNHFFGTILGNTVYVRNRDLEFSQRNVLRNELIQKTEDAARVVDKVLSGMTDEQLKLNYPVPYNNETVTAEYFLIHLATHLSYHLGQVNYHRRLLDKP